MYQICKDLVDILRKKSLTLSCAESCTGGLVAKMITDIAGASEVFFGGVVSYTSEIKERVLGIKHEIIEKYTVYSEEVAKEMAEGVKSLYKSDIGISTTGIAGPGGGDTKNPVGTVYIAVALPNKTETVRLQIEPTFSREEIRECASLDIINYLIGKIEENY